MSELNKTQNFIATVKKDGATSRLKMASPAFFQNHLNKYREGEKVVVSVSSKLPKRTLAQNNFYWMYLNIIAGETGHAPEEIHSWVKGKFLTERIVEVFGVPTRVVGSTASLSKDDFSELISRVEAETGIAAPNTEEWLTSEVVDN